MVLFKHVIKQFNPIVNKIFGSIQSFDAYDLIQSLNFDSIQTLNFNSIQYLEYCSIQYLKF